MTPPPLNAGMPWCEHQDAALLSLLENGADAEHIAEALSGRRGPLFPGFISLPRRGSFKSSMR